MQFAVALHELQCQTTLNDINTLHDLDQLSATPVIKYANTPLPKASTALYKPLKPVHMLHAWSIQWYGYTCDLSEYCSCCRKLMYSQWHALVVSCHLANFDVTFLSCCQLYCYQLAWWCHQAGCLRSCEYLPLSTRHWHVAPLTVPTVPCLCICRSMNLAPIATCRSCSICVLCKITCKSFFGH